MEQMLLMGILGLAIVMRIAHIAKTKSDPVLALILAGVAVTRVGIGLVNEFLGPLPGAQIDAIMFDETARNMASIPTGAVNFVFEAGKMGYSSLLAIFYMIGGYHFFIATLINLAFTVEFVRLVYEIAEQWSGPLAGRISAASAAFYPTSILYTSVPLREAPLMWAFALFVKALLDYYDGKRRLISPPLIAGMALLVWLHDGFALAIFLVPVAMWFRYRDVSIAKRLAFIGAGVVAIFAVFVLALSFIDFNKMPADPAMLLDPTFLARMREVKSAYGVGYGEVEASWMGLLKSGPLFFFAFIAAPFPFWWGGVGELPKVAEGMVHLALVVGACFTVFHRSMAADPRRRMALVMYLYIIFVFAMGTGNTGIAARHRAKFVWMPVTLVTVVWCTVGRSRQAVRSGSGSDLLPGVAVQGGP